MKGRPRQQGVVRDASGTSRESRERERRDYERAVTRREARLACENVPVSLDGKQTAADALAGHSLGKLLIRHRADPLDPSSISQNQYDWGLSWARVLHRHAGIMGYKINIATPSFVVTGGGESCRPEPEEDEIVRIRRQFSDCYRELVDACKSHRSWAIRNVTYGACVEDWPIARISEAGFMNLRIGLNAVGRGLRVGRKS